MKNKLLLICEFFEKNIKQIKQKTFELDLKFKLLLFINFTYNNKKYIYNKYFYTFL